MSSKYLVVKRADVERLKRDKPVSTEGFKYLDELDLEDAEVIRLQDITAAPILYTYASVIRSFVDLHTTMAPGDMEALHEVADWAMNAAEKSEALGASRKLPD